MAKHAAQGLEFPVFFYGQHYALETVEAGVGALGFMLFGVGALTLKLAMLALWTLGVLFWFLALSRLVGTHQQFLDHCPAGSESGLGGLVDEGRGGGDITAFTATAILLWLVMRNREKETIARWLAAGLLTGVIYLAQPLWLPGVLPILLAMLASRRRVWWGIGYLAVAALAILVVKLTTGTETEAWGGPVLGNHDLFGSKSRVARQVYVFLTGAYYLSWAIDPPGPVTNGLAIVWCGVLPGRGAGAAAIGCRTPGATALPSHLLFASVCSTLLAEWALLGARDARYLLPLGALLVTLAGVELVDLVDRRLLPKPVAVFLVAVMLLLGSLSMREFREFNYLWKNPPDRWTEARRLQQVFGYLKVSDVSHVFSMNGMLDSQLVFYSDEKVISRWTNPLARYPAYVKEVDRALANGEKVAIVGYTHTSGAPGLLGHLDLHRRARRDRCKPPVDFHGGRQILRLRGR